MSWTEEKVDKLRELWGKGNTASQIAEIIGGISRNAVIGKAHRLNLSAKIKTRTATSNQNFDSSLDGILASEINRIHVISSVPSVSTFRISVLSSASAGSISGGGTNVIATFQN